MASIPLNEMIQSLRAELESATESASQGRVRLSLQEVELELSVELARSTRGDGKVEFRVFGVGAGVDGSIEAHRSHAQKFKLVLKVSDDVGNALKVNSTIRTADPG